MTNEELASALDYLGISKYQLAAELTIAARRPIGHTVVYRYARRINGTPPGTAAFLIMACAAKAAGQPYLPSQVLGIDAPKITRDGFQNHELDITWALPVA